MMVSSASVFSGASGFPRGAGAERLSAIDRLIVRDIETQWTKVVAAKLNDLVKLPEGWDGYDGKSVDFRIAHFAVQLLQHVYVEGVPSPSLVPGSDGSLQIEWHSNGLDIELDILGVNQVDCLKRDLETGGEEELELTVDFKAVRAWIEDLAGRASDAVTAAA